MSRQPRKTKQYRRQGKNLISTNKIKPKTWQISNTEAKEALKAKGYDVKEVKKIHCLKHQVSISFWDTKGNICSSFFSYRIFARWQSEVEKLINNCENLKAWTKLNYILNYEFRYYSYLSNIENAIHQALENRCLVLKATSQQAVFIDIQ
jgi:hypothetical protein